MVLTLLIIGWTAIGACLGVLVASALNDVAEEELLRQPDTLRKVKRFAIGVLTVAFAVCAAVSAQVASW